MRAADRRIVRSLVVALVLVSAIPVVGIAAEAVAFSQGRPGVVAWLEDGGPPLCHHRPERTLRWHDRALPVCARCTGVYGAWPLSLVVGLAVPLSARRIGWGLSAALGASALGFGAAVLEALDWLRTANETRLALGALLGCGPPLALGLMARALWAEAQGPE